MTQNIFKSAKSNLELRVVRANTDHLRIIVSDRPHIEDRVIDLSLFESPELCLAILEAAGYDDKADDMTRAEGYAFDALHKLQQSVDEQARFDAETEDQAKLEVEATYPNEVDRIWIRTVRQALEVKPFENEDLE